MPRPRPPKGRQLHPRQVRLDITMSNGVTNAAIFTLHDGAYAFVEEIKIEGIKVGFMTMDAEDVARRKNCVTQEVGHKVPASTIRKVDGRLIGSCEKCYERINIARFPGTEACAEAAGLIRAVLFDTHASPEAYLDGVATLERRLAEDLKAVEAALADTRRAKALLIGRMARPAGAP